MQREIKQEVTSKVTHPPSPNLIVTVTIRIVPVRSKPSPLTQNFRSQRASVLLTSHQCLHMPSWESVNVKKTLMLYMTTKQTHPALGVEKETQRGQSHEPNTVPCYQPVAQERETMRRPGVQCHIGEDARTIDKTGLCRHQQYRRFGDQRRDNQRGGQRTFASENDAVNFAKKSGVQSFAGHVGNLVQQVAK